MTLRRFLLAGAMASSVGITFAADWPTFRGPDGTGAVSTGKLPVEWSADQNVAWKVAVPGVAWSCPIVVGDNIFVTTAFAEGQPKPRAGGGFGGGGSAEAVRRERAAVSGRPAAQAVGHRGGWRSTAGRGRTRGFGGRPGPDKVYTWKVVCLDKATGKVKWEQTVVRRQAQVQHAQQQYLRQRNAGQRRRTGLCLLRRQRHRRRLRSGRQTSLEERTRRLSESEQLGAHPVRRPCTTASFTFNATTKKNRSSSPSTPRPATKSGRSIARKRRTGARLTSGSRRTGRTSSSAAARKSAATIRPRAR